MPSIGSACHSTLFPSSAHHDVLFNLSRLPCPNNARHGLPERPSLRPPVRPAALRQVPVLAPPPPPPPLMPPPEPPARQPAGAAAVSVTNRGIAMQGLMHSGRPGRASERLQCQVDGVGGGARSGGRGPQRARWPVCLHREGQRGTGGRYRPVC